MAARHFCWADGRREKNQRSYGSGAAFFDILHAEGYYSFSDTFWLVVVGLCAKINIKAKNHLPIFDIISRYFCNERRKHQDNEQKQQKDYHTDDTR